MNIGEKHWTYWPDFNGLLNVYECEVTCLIPLLVRIPDRGVTHVSIKKSRLFSSKIEASKECIGLLKIQKLNLGERIESLEKSLDVSKRKVCSARNERDS